MEMYNVGEGRVPNSQSKHLGRTTVGRGSAFLLMSSLSLLDSTVSVLVREIFGVLWLVRMLVFPAQFGFFRERRQFQIRPATIQIRLSPMSLLMDTMSSRPARHRQTPMSLLMDSKRDDALLRTALLLLLAIVVLFLAVRFHAVSRSGGQQQQSFARMEEESDAAAAGARAHDRDRVGGPDIEATAADGAVPFGAVARARPPRVGTERSEAADELRNLAREKSLMHARRQVCRTDGAERGTGGAGPVAHERPSHARAPRLSAAAQRFGRIPSKRSVSKELSSYCAMCSASQEGFASAAAHGAAPPAAAEEAADASEPRSDLASGSSSVQGSVPLPSPVSMPPSLSDTFKDPRRGASGHGASAAEGQAPGGAAAPQGGRVGIAGGASSPPRLAPSPT